MLVDNSALTVVWALQIGYATFHDSAACIDDVMYTYMRGSYSMFSILQVCISIETWEWPGDKFI